MNKYEISKIYHHIIESEKRLLLENISNKLLHLELKKNNSIKTKCLKRIVKKSFLNFIELNYELILN